MWILAPIEKTNSVKQFTKNVKDNKNKKWKDIPDEHKSEIKNKLFHIYAIIWLFIGLFTFQWLAYLIIISFNFLIISV
jgi:hypothetical protein